MRVLMLNPPFFKGFSRSSRSPGVSKGGCVYYPLWLGAATGWLEKHGHEVKLLDCPVEEITTEDVAKILDEWKPELVVFDSVTASATNDFEVARQLRSHSKAKFVFVGTSPSALPEKTLKECDAIDLVTQAEYDKQLLNLANNVPLEKIKGISYRLKDGSIRHNPSEELLTGKELDEFPFMSEVFARHLKIKNYFYPSVLYPETTIVTGRGCPFHCTFCVLPQVMNDHQYRARSPESVFAEMKWIHDNLPEVKDVMIEDDTFTADRERVKNVCRLIIENGLKIAWTVNARADVDLETLQLMKQAGCRLLCVGFESADQTILNNIKKGTTIPKIEQFMKDTKTAGLLVHGCFMIGNKGETRETIRKTLDMAIRLEPDTVQFFPIMVYPGTEAYEYAAKQGHLTTNNFSHWLLPDGTHNSIISTPDLSAQDLVRECDRSRVKFYGRPKFMLKKFWQVLQHPSDLPRTIKSGITFSKYFIKEFRG
ncbi:MAG: radical SAM protein [Candidatus Micrarchaeota archaeon]